jgi:hypothetical protein
MLTSPQYTNRFGAYDPLATQFMTQGQMGYMPQAQFLTSSDYGAYRTMPGMNMNAHQDQQSMSMWQAYLQSRRGNVMGMTGDYFLNTYNPLRSQTNQTVMAQRRLSDMQGSLGGAVGDLGLSMALPMIGGALGGPLGFMVGSALSMITPNIGEELASRRRQTREIQNMSMPSVVSGDDMATTLGRGFSTTAADKLRRNIDREAVDDMVFNKEDYSSFLKSGIENNLMDYSSDASQYMGTLKKLSGNIKFLKEAFENKDIQTIFSDMKRLQTMGAALPDMQGIGHTEAMFARIAGITHDQMVSSYGQPGAMQFTQKGLTGYQGSLTSMGHAANITLAQRSGLISAEELSRVGGKSGLTQSFTEGSATWQKTIEDTFVPGLMDTKGEVDFKKLSGYMGGDISLTQMHNASAGALQHNGGENVAAIMQHSAKALGSIQKNLGPQGMTALMAKYYTDIGTQALGKDADVQDRMFLGARTHLGTEAAHEFAKQYSSPEMQKNMIRQLEIQQRKLADAAKQEYVHENSFKNRLFKAFRRTGYNVFGSTWDKLRRIESENSEENEQRRLGIFSTMDRGMSSSLGLDSLESAGYSSAEQEDASRADLYKTIRNFKAGEESALEKGLASTLRDTSSKGTRSVVDDILGKAVSGDLSEEGLVSVVRDNAKAFFSDDFIKANTRKDGTLGDEAIKNVLFKENGGALSKFLLGRTQSYAGTDDEKKINAWTLQYAKDQTEQGPRALADKDAAFLREFEKGIFQEDTRELRAQVAFRNKALHTEMSEEDIAAARKDLEVSGADMTKALRGMDADHFSKEEFAKRYALMTNKSVKEAHEDLSKHGGRGYQYVAFKALSGRDGTNLRIGIEDLQEKDRRGVAEHLKEHTQKMYDKAFKAQKAFVGNERNAESLAKLSTGIDDHEGREGANFLVAAHAILNRQEESGGWFGEDTTEEDREAWVNLWTRNTDMGRDEIVSMFDNMRRDKVDAYAATRNTDADELKEIHERAGDTHLTRKTGKEIVELSGAAGDKTRQAMLAGATTNMTYAIAKELGVSGHKGRVPDVSELLGDPEKTKKLLDSVQDKDSTGAQILKQIKDLQSSGKSMNVAQFAGKMAHDGIVETGVEVSSKKVSTVVGSEDTKLAQDTLEAQINALQVLKTSAQHTKDNTDATKNLTKAYKQKVTEESSIFSLFKLGS